MSKYIKVGSGGGEMTWHRAMLDMEPGTICCWSPAITFGPGAGY